MVSVGWHHSKRGYNVGMMMGRANPRTTHLNAGIPANHPIKAIAIVRSFAEAEAFLADPEHDGPHSERPLASNVRVVQRSYDAIAIRLYNTDIITYYRDGTFSFDNGGFNTPTTSTRCNQFGPRGWFFYHHKQLLRAWCGSTLVTQGERVRV